MLRCKRSEPRSTHRRLDAALTGLRPSRLAFGSHLRMRGLGGWPGLAAPIASAPSPMKTLDLLAFGEPLMEFAEVERSGERLYLPGFGGDSSNAAIAAARQGAKVAYFTALGDDAFGRGFLGLWDAEGVDRSAVITRTTACCTCRGSARRSRRPAPTRSSPPSGTRGRAAPRSATTPTCACACGLSTGPAPS